MSPSFIAPAVASSPRPTLSPEAAVAALALVPPLVARGGPVAAATPTTLAAADALAAQKGAVVAAPTDRVRTCLAAKFVASPATWRGTVGTATKMMMVIPCKTKKKLLPLPMVPTGSTQIGMSIA